MNHAHWGARLYIDWHSFGLVAKAEIALRLVIPALQRLGKSGRNNNGRMGEWNFDAIQTPTAAATHFIFSGLTRSIDVGQYAPFFPNPNIAPCTFD